jgi:TRAP-type transport system periplasmic protein
MFRTFLGTTAAALLIAPSVQAEGFSLRVLGQPVGSGLIQQQKEQPFFDGLAASTGLDVTVEYLPVDVAGIPDTDGLRVLRSGLFDIVSLRGPQVSRDEPTVLGFDLVGLNPSFEAGPRPYRRLPCHGRRAPAGTLQRQTAGRLARGPAGDLLQARDRALPI